MSILALGTGCSPPPPQAVNVALQCVPEGDVLHQRCTVHLTDRRTGRGVGGATITLLADMPSMPLVHSLAPVTAVPDSPPGTYRGTLTLQMAGRWVVVVRIAGPIRDQTAHVIDVD